ncbi:MAG: hypothetical protein H0V31_11170 [Acidobacteria bacterium]|jgi:hypothetical protein|nr:hypothetical protein [Acidobacteriota bacterium]
MAKHKKTFVDFDKPYETNLIGFRGVIYFGVGLFLLVVVTFGLMLFLQNVMEEQAIEVKDQKSPMAMNEQERLPPEPRLQAAPGFGVDSSPGRVNLELKAPQSEYRELQEQWEKILKDGQTDPKTGTVISLPIEEAKRKLLEENPKANSSADGQKMVKDSRSMVSSSSAGRIASDVRR